MKIQFRPINDNLTEKIVSKMDNEHNGDVKFAEGEQGGGTKITNHHNLTKQGKVTAKSQTNG